MISNKRGQVAVFVIIALVIVAGIAGYFIIKNNVFTTIPASIAPVQNYYVSCLNDVVRDGASLMASQGGYIYSPDFAPGSEYAPFSSKLGFMGLGIPYWYYLSANGVKKEQIPTLNQMQQQLSRYVLEEATGKCDFSSFTNQGYEISVENVSGVKSTIAANKITLSVNQKISVKKGSESYVLNNYAAGIDSNLGNFYAQAKKIYDYERKTNFIENYSIDTLYTYAPVSGVVLNCSPTVWNPYDVVDKLKNALQANIGMLKLNGDYYSSGKNTQYFVVGKNGDFNIKGTGISFVYSPNWSSRFEVWPTKNNLMIANPLGTQQGLTGLGFCYAPYKFVYDMYFPVLIQIYDPLGQEVFQFPISIIIDKNVPNQALPADYVQEQNDLCDNANTNITINTYNVNLGAVESNIEFKCLDSSCSLGSTRLNNFSGTSSLSAMVPQCVNGVLIAKSPGYVDKKYIISTNEETSADIVLDREYDVPLEIYVDGVLTNDNAVLLVNKNAENSTDFVNSVSYPLIKDIKLGEGDYNFELDVYKNGNINIPATTTKQCVKQPKDGIFGSLLGLEEDKCYDVTLPSQTIANLISAGGKIDKYITPDELENASVIRIYATSIKLPTSLEEVQNSFDAVNGKSLTVEVIK